MAAPHFLAVFVSSSDFIRAFDAEISKAGLLIRGASFESAVAMSECGVSVQVGAGAAIEVPARVAATVPGVGVAVVFSGVPGELAALAEKLRAGGADPSPQPQPEETSRLLSERLKEMTVTEKMQLALAGSREERLALMRDVNKAIHVFVFRNPRVGLDEVQYGAKQTTLSPDALKMISEHREWGMNPTVCTALVRNPRTPLPIAVKLLDRIPANELRAVAKGGARDQIVQAARKKLAG